MSDAVPLQQRGPHPVVILRCGWCALAYEESAVLLPAPRVLARPDLPASAQPPGAHGCPRCGTRDDQAVIGRSER